MQVNYDKLWKLMIDKKINKTQLSEKAGIQYWDCDKTIPEEHSC